MTKDVILSRAGEHLVECTILYMYPDEDLVNRLYFDMECTKCLTREEMIDAYLKRCVITDGRQPNEISAYGIPMMLEDHNSYAGMYGVADRASFTMFSSEYVKP
jgi:hypothetical protein